MWHDGKIEGLYSFFEPELFQDINFQELNPPLYFFHYVGNFLSSILEAIIILNFNVFQGTNLAPVLAGGQKIAQVYKQNFTSRLTLQCGTT